MERKKRTTKRVVTIQIEQYLAEYITAKYCKDNLCIHLPQRKAGIIASPWKDPAYYNYISPAAAKEIEAQIRRMFNFELHRVLLENEEFGRQKRNLDVIYDFIRSYQLKSISSDALLKNYYRFRNRLRPKKVRKYQKSACI